MMKRSSLFYTALLLVSSHTCAVYECIYMCVHTCIHTHTYAHCSVTFSFYFTVYLRFCSILTCVELVCCRHSRILRLMWWLPRLFQSKLSRDFSWRGPYNCICLSFRSVFPFILLIIQFLVSPFCSYRNISAMDCCLSRFLPSLSCGNIVVHSLNIY